MIYEIAPFLPYFLTIIGSLIGSWIAIKSALKIHDWRLNEQKEVLLRHSGLHISHERRLVLLEVKEEWKKD